MKNHFEMLDGIEKMLKDLKKSEEPEDIKDDEELEEEFEDEPVEDEIGDEETTDYEVEAAEEDDFEDEEDEEFEKSEEPAEDEELEKSEEPEDEEFEEEPEDPDEYLSTDEVIKLIIESDELQNYIAKKVEEELEGFKDILDKQSEVAKTQADATVDNAEKTDEIEKSLGDIKKSLDDALTKLSKQKPMKKSIDNVKVMEKYNTNNKVDINNLSKSQVSTILFDAFENGNKNVSIQDITNAELGKPISNRAIEVIKNSIK